MSRRGLLSLCILFCLAALVACGSPRTAVRVLNRADGNETTITIKQGDGGSTSVTITPSMSVAVDTVALPSTPTGRFLTGQKSSTILDTYK